MCKITIFKLRLINNSLKYRCFLKENTIKTKGARNGIYKRASENN